MTGVDYHWNASEPASDYAVVMDQVIMSMQNIRPINPQLRGHLSSGAQMWSGRLLKRSYEYTFLSRLCSDSPRMRQTVDRRHMAGRKLTIRQVDCQPFKTTHIEIVNKLNNPHSLQSISVRPLAGSRGIKSGDRTDAPNEAPPFPKLNLSLPY
jgi:hypothetical protein